MSTKAQAASGLRDYLRELDGKAKAIDEERAAVRAALAELSPNGPVGTVKRKQRHRRHPNTHYQHLILDHLRTDPDAIWEVNEVARALGVPKGSVRVAVHRLMEDGKVTVVGTTAYGGPQFRHKPTKVTPGQEVTG